MSSPDPGPAFPRAIRFASASGDFESRLTSATVGREGICGTQPGRCKEGWKAGRDFRRPRLTVAGMLASTGVGGAIMGLLIVRTESDADRGACGGEGRILNVDVEDAKSGGVLPPKLGADPRRRPRFEGGLKVEFAELDEEAAGGVDASRSPDRSSSSMSSSSPPSRAA